MMEPSLEFALLPCRRAAVEDPIVRTAFKCAAFGAMAALCLGSAGASEFLDSTSRRAPGLPPTGDVAVPRPVELTGPGATEPDIGLEGGGRSFACRPIFSGSVVQAGHPTGEPEKDSFGHVVDRVECDPG